MGLHYHSILAWDNGSKFHNVGKGIVSGDAFVVRAEDPGKWVAVNVLVFARSSSQAIKIVQDALLQAVKEDYKSKPGAEYHYATTPPKERTDKLFLLEWKAEPYNKEIISQVQWAQNHTILG